MLDEYEIKARLAPGLLVAMPIGVAALIYFGVDFGLDAGVIAAGIMLGGGVLLSRLMSDLGGGREQKLFESWGGMPSLQVLRHRDPTVGEAAKTRLHATLQTKAKLPMPSATAESEDPIAADRAYRLASDWLRSNTRGKEKFPTLFARNCEYGFVRNSYGATAWAIATSAVTILVIVATDLLTSTRSPETPMPALGLTPNALVSVACALFWSLFWRAYFTTSRVRSAAFSYARALLEQADAI